MRTHTFANNAPNINEIANGRDQINPSSVSESTGHYQLGIGRLGQGVELLQESWTERRAVCYTGVTGGRLAPTNGTVNVFEWLGKFPLRPRPRTWLRPPDISTRAIDLVLLPGEHATWSRASVGDQSMLQLFAEVNVVNTSDCSVMLVSAKLKKPAAEGLVHLQGPDRTIPGSHPLVPFVATRASVYFYVHLPEPPAGTTVVADVGFVDRYGNTHWCEKIRFRSVARDRAP